MPLYRAPEIQQVQSILWVDTLSPVDISIQDGTIERPYSTVQQAIDHAAAGSSPTWNFQIAHGDYSAQALTIPSNLSIVIEGRTKRASECRIGDITWAVTGNQTSSITLRRIHTGNVTINDDVTPAVLVRFVVLDCDLGGTTVTGTSVVNLALGGETNANFDPSLSSVTASVVSGPISLGSGILLASNTQFQPTCTSILAAQMFGGGCSFSQDITISGQSLQLLSSTFGSTPHAITSTNATVSDALTDHESSVSFVDNGWTQSNFAIKIATFESTGITLGGLVTRNSGLQVNVSAGEGLLFHQTESATRFVSWAGATITLPANTLSDIYVDDTNTVLSAPHPINQKDGIILATAGTNATDVISLSAERVESLQVVPQLSEYATKLFGALHVEGLVTTIYNAPSLQLQVDSGSYYNGIHFNEPSATAPITFTAWYRDGSGGWTQVPGQTTIDPNFWDDGSGTLAALNPGQWKKDTVFVSTNDSGTEYHVIYAQQTYISQDQAVAGNIPAAPEDVLITSLRIAGAVVQGGATEVTVVVDLRPKIGQLSSGTTAVTDHGLLSGLSRDDHHQYQLRTEKDQPNGYAGLNASSKLTGSEQVYGTASNTAVEGNDPRVPTQNENDALQGTSGAPSNTNRYITDVDPRVPTQSENDALVGTNGTPSGTNPFVTNSDPRVPTQSENDALVGTDGTPSGTNAFITNSDPRVPTQNENDALQGTNGTPSNSDRYVTDSDPRNTNARTPTAHASTHLPSGSDPLATGTPVDIGTSNNAGTANSFAKSDHVHNLPFAPVQTALAAATSDISVNSQKIINLNNPVADSDAATKAYVDSVAHGLDWKASVRVATTANITLSGTQTIDGVSVIVGNRVLVKNQSTASANGIYDVASGAWTRSSDATSGNVSSGLATFVSEGSTQANSAWVLTTPDPITLGTTALSFTQMSGQGTYLAGNGITLTGNTFSLTTPVSIANGGTNSSSALVNNRLMISSSGSIVEASAITGNRALTSNSSGIPVASSVTDTELSYVSGVTSSIQTQLNGKQSTLTIGNLTDAGTDGITVTGGTGAVIGTGTSISQHVADSTHNGYLSSTDWSTFNNKQSALTIGNLTDAGTDGITVTNGTGAVIGTGTSIAQHVADATHNGYLSSTDWSTFNAKVPATRLISTGTGLTGGGDLSADRTISLSIPVVITNGGTNSVAALNNNRIMISSGGAIVETVAITASRALVSDTNGLPVAALTTTTEINYVSGVTSAIQTQINSKKTTATGNAYKFETTDASGNLQETTVTASRAVVTDANGLPSASATTATEISYVSGVTSSIQTQLNNKQPLSTTLTSLSSFNTNGLMTQTASNTFTARSLTAPASGITISNNDGVSGNPTFALANDLAAVEGLATNGIAVRTATDTWTTRSLTAPAAGMTITNPDGISGSPTFAFANDLGAIEALNTNGMLARTATDTWAARTITGTASNITVTNGDGIAGNPTLNLATVTQGSGGSFVKVTLDSFGRVTQNTPVVASDITALGFHIGPAGADTQIQYNSGGSAFGASSAFTFTTGTNPYVSITGTTATNQFRIGGSASINNATAYIESNASNQDGLRVYFNSGTAATSGIIAYAYSGSQPYIRVVDADDDPSWIQFDTIGAGTEAAPAISNRFGGRGPTAGSTTGFSWYVNGTEISQMDSNYFLPPSGTTAARPGTPTAGMFRYNSDLGLPEAYFQGDWRPIFQAGSNAYNSVFDDFQTNATNATAISTLNWDGATNGAGTSISDVQTGTDSGNNAIGVLELATGTAAAGRAGIGRGSNSLIFGNAQHIMEWRVWVNTLATAAQDFTAYFGFGDTYNAAGDVVDGIYFQYQRSSSTNWRICTASNSTRTQTNTTTAVVAGAWVKLRIEVNAAGTSAQFFVNGTSVGTITTNIPTGAGRNCGAIAKIEKSAGGTARQVSIDYFSHRYIYTTPR